MRVRMLCLCLLAVCAGVGATASSAAALEPAGPPEFGRCVKTTGLGGPGYTNSNCTTPTLSGAKYEWQPGPGAEPGFTVAERVVRGPNLRHCERAARLELKAEQKEAEAKRKIEEAERYEELAAIARSKGEEGLAKLYEEDAARCRKEAATLDNEAASLRGGAVEARHGLTKAECEKIIEEKSEKEEPVVLEPTVGAEKYTVECSELAGKGSYSATDAKQVDGVSLKFSGCELAAPTEVELEEGNGKCSSGSTAGVIEAVPLMGELGWIKKEGSLDKDKVGVDLWAEGGSHTAQVAEFTCGTGEHAFTIAVTGSVIHEVKIDKMLSKETEKVSERNGEQIPESFEGEEPDVLRAHLDGLSIQAGMGLLSKLESLEKMEVNAAA